MATNPDTDLVCTACRWRGGHSPACERRNEPWPVEMEDCLHCGRSITSDQYRDVGECEACVLWQSERDAIEYFGASVVIEEHAHCGCYYVDGDKCCTCGESHAGQA